MLPTKSAAGGLVACALVLSPVTSASAQYYYCHDIICGLGTAIVGTAAAIVTLPFAVVGAVTAPLRPPAYYYAPPPAYYYGPPSAYYRPPPAYYRPPPPAYYARPSPPGYYAPPSRPAYYGPPATYPAPGYYYGR